MWVVIGHTGTTAISKDWTWKKRTQWRWRSTDKSGNWKGSQRRKMLCQPKPRGELREKEQKRQVTWRPPCPLHLAVESTNPWPAHEHGTPGPNPGHSWLNKWEMKEADVNANWVLEQLWRGRSFIANVCSASCKCISISKMLMKQKLGIAHKLRGRRSSRRWQTYGGEKARLVEPRCRKCTNHRAARTDCLPVRLKSRSGINTGSVSIQQSHFVFLGEDGGRSNVSGMRLE